MVPPTINQQIAQVEVFQYQSKPTSTDTAKEITYNGNHTYY